MRLEVWFMAFTCASGLTVSTVDMHVVFFGYLLNVIAVQHNLYLLGGVVFINWHLSVCSAGINRKVLPGS